MTKGNVLENLGVVTLSDNRTEKLLQQFNLDSSFLDPKLPKGLFSNSQYNAWLKCGKFYEYRYVQQLPDIDTVPLAKGVAVHAGVEVLLKAKMAGTLKTGNQVEAAKDAAGSKFDEKAANVTDWGEDTSDDVRGVTVKLVELYAKLALPKINPVAIEKGFAKKIGDVPMIGYIDLIDEQPAIKIPGMSSEDAAMAPKRRITADLKTGTKWSKNELDKDPQLTLYAMVEGTPDVRVDQVLMYKAGPTYVAGESTRTPEHAAVYTEHLHEVVDYIKKGVFPKTPIDNWACTASKCSYYSQCRGKKK